MVIKTFEVFDLGIELCVEKPSIVVYKKHIIHGFKTNYDIVLNNVRGKVSYCIWLKVVNCLVC